MAQLTIRDVLPLVGSRLKIPRLGFGVFKAPQDVTVNACLEALKAGYRHIDTAQAYHNEAEVGEAIRKSNIPREEIFVTTKIANPGGSTEKSYKQCLASVEKMGLDYVDLFLIHSPVSGLEARKEVWAALEQLQKDGKTKSIGVSNFGVHHLEELKGYATVFPPAVNQIELHPWFQQKDIVKWCKDNGVVVEAYCPIVRNKKKDDPILNEIAKKYGKTTTQVLIRWSLQQGWVPLPKSEATERIKANADIYDFELSKEDDQKLKDLDQGREGGISWQPQYRD